MRWPSAAGSEAAASDGTTIVPPEHSVQNSPATELSNVTGDSNRNARDGFGIERRARLRRLRQVAVGDEDAFGGAGRPRRVDDIGEVVRPDPRLPPRGAGRRSAAMRQFHDLHRPPPPPAARTAACVTSTGAPVSASIHPSRSGGVAGSIGTYAPPAFNTPSSATTRSTDRSRHTATRTSGPTPRARSAPRHLVRRPLQRRVRQRLRARR